MGGPAGRTIKPAKSRWSEAMIVYIGFDDTDTLESDFGTGKLARWFQDMMPEGCECRGVVRQQLLVSDDIPYTSHNSAACMAVEVSDEKRTNGIVRELADLASDHINRHAADGSDPGLCVVDEFDLAMENILEFGRHCTNRVSTQKEALQAVNGAFLAGLGGTNDGLIGAAAAVGLTASGWSGRYIEFGNLRRYPETISVSELNSRQIEVMSTDRDARRPAPQDRVLTNGWVRPLLVGHKPVLFVTPKENGLWVNIHAKRNKKAVKHTQS
jgi:hypothetical protein